MIQCSFVLYFIQSVILLGQWIPKLGCCETQYVPQTTPGNTCTFPLHILHRLCFCEQRRNVNANRALPHSHIGQDGVWLSLPRSEAQVQSCKALNLRGAVIGPWVPLQRSRIWLCSIPPAQVKHRVGGKVGRLCGRRATKGHFFTSRNFSLTSLPWSSLSFS